MTKKKIRIAKEDRTGRKEDRTGRKEEIDNQHKSGQYAVLATFAAQRDYDLEQKGVRS